MYFLYWIIFFSAYGVAWFVYCQWLAQRRIAALTDPSHFGRKQRILAFLGSISFATAPPLVELAVRIWDERLSQFVFLAFIGAWIVSASPGIIAGRRMLKAGGIDPDQEA
jgi:hypothetical protein